MTFVASALAENEEAVERDRFTPCPPPEVLAALAGDGSLEPDRMLTSLLAWSMYACGVQERTQPDGSKVWTTRWVRGEHIVYLCKRIVALYRGDVRRLAISLPPRHSKSQTTSRLGPAWWLGHDPRARAVVCSYSERMARKMTEFSRDVMAAYGPSAFGVRALRRAAASDWKLYEGKNKTGGSMRGVGVDGSLTGDDVDLLVCDDLYKDERQAKNASTRRSVLEWWESVPFTRMEPWTKAIVMGTRWHEEDVIGWLKDRQKAGKLAVPFEFINLPAIAEEDDLLGRAPGDPLWPERFGRRFYEELKHETAPRLWASVYQGRPAPLEGGLFKAKWIRRYTEENGWLVYGTMRVERSRLGVYATVDLAGSKKERADWTVVGVWGIDYASKTLWLLEVYRRRIESPAIIDLLKEVKADHNPGTFYCEKAGPQVDLVHALKLAADAGEAFNPNEEARERDVIMNRAIDEGIAIQKLIPIADKVTRSGQAQAILHAGRMFIPEASAAAWVPIYTAELLVFPDGGKHDDQVDVTSYGAKIFLEVLAARSLLEQRARAQGSGGLPIGGTLGLG